MSFHQVQLELCRIYVHLERKKTKHEKIIKKEKRSLTKKSSKDDEKEAEFNEDDMKGKKGKKKGEKEADLLIDQVLTYENKEDELYFYESSERDKGFDLPIGPLRLLRFRFNPYVELYLANTNSMTDSLDFHEKSIAELVKRHRFNPFKPKFNTMCPRCTINPQSQDYVRKHLKTIHSINRKDETDKIMKTVTLQAVEVQMPFPPIGDRMEMKPPAAPGFLSERNLALMV